QHAYVKASNTEGSDMFGSSVSLSGDGNSLAVGAFGDDSNATGIDGDQNNSDATNSGAVYLYTRSDGNWSQRAYVKASNTGINEELGRSVALSNDGNSLAAGAYHESGDATGVGGEQDNKTVYQSGAAYLY